MRFSLYIMHKLLSLILSYSTALMVQQRTVQYGLGPETEEMPQRPPETTTVACDHRLPSDATVGIAGQEANNLPTV